MQERSLDFARDDDTGIAFSKHIRCTLREINPSPPTVISSAARNLPCTLLFLAPFAKGFPFSAIPHRALYQCAGKIEGFARDDDTGIAFYKHIRCTLRGINPFPHTVISSAARNLPCTPSFLAPFAKGFPFSVIPHTAHTDVQERSLHFGRDDNEDGALLSLFSCRHAKECLFEAH